ncbi:MAG: fumarylacetoacetate hydrolase family protein [Thermodesulfobacteriota bacterium]
MRLVRIGTKGNETPGILKPEGVIRLRRIFPDIPDIGETFFRDGWLDKIMHIQEPIESVRVRFGCPVSRPSKIICLGKNYPEHAKEGGFEPPKKPLLFSKAPSSLNGPYDPILLPSGSGQVDWEVELALVIGKEGKRIKKDAALDYIAGFMIMNDVSGREAQFSDHQWFRGKSFDTFAPAGPSLVTFDEIQNPYNLNLKALVNGVIMQEGNTSQMVFDIGAIMEFVSRDITLIPGDIISTGTPSGVGVFRNPPVFLKEGDVVECIIEGIGSLVNRIAVE